MKRIYNIVILSFPLFLIFFISLNVQAYEERLLTDEKSFIDEISKYDTVWVMYTYNGVKGTEFEERGDKFWNLLKKEFGDQVNAYLVIDTTEWGKVGSVRVYDVEIGKRKAPSFLLYKHGKVMNDGTEDDVRIAGVPNSEQFPLYIKAIKRACFLR